MLSKMLIAGANKSVSSFTFVASAVSSAATIVIPATAAIGDIAILFNGGSAQSATAPTTVVPTGWTTIINSFFSSGSALVTSSRLISSYKKLVSGDPGATITGMSAGNGVRSTILVFRPNSSIATITTGSVNGQCINGTPTNQTLAMSGVTRPLLGFATNSTFGTVALTVSGVTTVDVANTTAQDTKYIIYNKGSTPANATVSSTANTANGLQSFYIQFT